MQTVVWNSTDLLDGYGLLFDDFQGQVDPFDADQDFILDVQLLNPTDQDQVVSTVGSETFTIEPGDVAPSTASSDSLLFIDLDTDLALVTGQSYAFHLYPVQTPENVENQRLYFADTVAGAYNVGFGRQTDGQPVPPLGVFPQPSGGFDGTDVAAFTTTVAVPEPASVGVIAAGLLGLTVRRRR